MARKQLGTAPSAATDAATKGYVDTGLSGKSDSAHSHTKAQVGLGNVDNTSDASKPVSTATQQALNTKADNRAFEPGSSGGARRYVRILTVAGGSPQGGANAQFILSGTGDYGAPRRGTLLIHIAQRDTVIYVKAWSFGVADTADKIELFTRKIGDYEYELWGLFADYNLTHNLVPISSRNTTVNLDSVTTTAPTLLQPTVIDEVLSGSVTISQVAELSTALAGKADTIHEHSAEEITSGVFTQGQLPLIPDSKIEEVSASKLTGVVSPTALPVAPLGSANPSQIVRADDPRLSDARPPVWHSHLPDDLVGPPVPVGKGGTGATTASQARGNLGAASENHIHTLSGPDISGTLPVSRGGTGASTASQALSNLGAAWAIARPLTTQHLDDVRTPGFYSQVVALDAQTVQRGYPLSQAGLMEVLSSSDGSLLWQRYTPTGTEAYSEWVRAYQSGTWGPWRRSNGEPRELTTDWWWMASSDFFYSELYLRAENGHLRTQGYLMPRGVYLTGPVGVGAIPSELRPHPASKARVDTYIPTSVNRQGVSFYCVIESSGMLGLRPSPYQTAVTLYADNHVTPHIPPYRVVG